MASEGNFGLTQDIDWDESRNVDLRELDSPAGRGERPGVKAQQQKRRIRPLEPPPRRRRRKPHDESPVAEETPASHGSEQSSNLLFDSLLQRRLASSTCSNTKTPPSRVSSSADRRVSFADKTDEETWPEWTAADLARLDAATTNTTPAATTAGKAMSTAKSSPRDSVFDNLPDMVFDTIDKTAAAAVEKAKPSLSPSVFGDDLPDMDYDAIDKQAETRLQQHAGAVQPQANDDDSDDDFGDDLDLEALVADDPSVDLPPACDAMVRNPRQRGVDANVNYLTFSRYRICRVQEHAGTRTLHVAAWRLEMMSENDSSALHRNELHEQWKEPKEWKADGVVHLRGEWFHAHVEEGDIIHICSLSGKFCTSADALPLILDTQPPRGSDNDDLLLVVHPDMLLVPTNIAETIGCTRRAVLKQRLGSTGLRSRAALFGTMRHDLFEAAMTQNKFDITELASTIETILRKNAPGLLACRISEGDARAELLKSAPQLQRFANKYTRLSGDASSSTKMAPLESYHGQGVSHFVAEHVEGIEMPVASPVLGLRGNIDMVVRARLRSTATGLQPISFYLAVELKTGHNQQTQNSHSAQLALYTLMLRAKYGTKASLNDQVIGSAKSGVLLYLNSESLRAVNVASVLPEIKSLMNQRNILATEALRASRPRGVRVAIDTKKNTTVSLDDPPPAALPEVLARSHSCQRCFSNRECMTYLAAEPDSTASKKKQIELLSQFTGSLSDEDFAYIRHWDRLVDIELDASTATVAKAWLQPSLEREKATSSCMSQMIFDPSQSSLSVVDASGPTNDETVFVSFKRAENATDLTSLRFDKDCHVVISSDASTGSPGAARAYFQVTKGAVAVLHERSVLIRMSLQEQRRIERHAVSGDGEAFFRIDRDEVSTQSGTLRHNLVNFFSGEHSIGDEGRALTLSNRHSRLRDLIVRLQRPNYDASRLSTMFAPRTPLRLAGVDLDSLAVEFAELNEPQRSAVERVFTAKDFALVQGLPGTGKTSVIALAVRLLAAHGRRVLVTSYTHNAVDNVYLKLLHQGITSMESATVVRIGNKTSCHPSVRPFLAEEVARRAEGVNHDVPPSAKFLKQAIDSAQVICVSALSVPRSPLLADVDFDVVIVDEAGQITQPAILGALARADTFVLVGDHMQLPPLVISELAERGGYGVSLLKRLAERHADVVAQLNLQYRMNQRICNLSNDIMYHGALRCGSEEVANRTLAMVGYPENMKAAAPWLVEAVKPQRPVAFLDTDGIEVNPPASELERSAKNRSGGNIVNDAEVDVARHLVRQLVACGVKLSSIGLISPFRAQASLLEASREIHDWKLHGLEVSTIDRYQGRDKDVIILSLVRSNTKGRVGRLLQDARRLNVAVTRAKCKLLMVGSLSTLRAGCRDVLGAALNRLEEDADILRLPSQV